jgi:hypothetical protein
MLMCFSAFLLAGSCDVKKKHIKLSDLDKGLKKYEKTQWDGVAKKKVDYVVSGNEKVDRFAFDSAVAYASLVQARYVADRVSSQLAKLKKTKSTKDREAAQENLKIARTILEDAVNSAPKLYKAGEDLVNHASSLLGNAAQLPQMIEAMKQSLKDLSNVISDGPGVLKHVVRLSQDLSGL